MVYAVFLQSEDASLNAFNVANVRAIRKSWWLPPALRIGEVQRLCLRLYVSVGAKARPTRIRSPLRCRKRTPSQKNASLTLAAINALYNYRRLE